MPAIATDDPGDPTVMRGGAGVGTAACAAAVGAASASVCTAAAAAVGVAAGAAAEMTSSGADTDAVTVSALALSVLLPMASALVGVGAEPALTGAVTAVYATPWPSLPPVFTHMQVSAKKRNFAQLCSRKQAHTHGHIPYTLIGTSPKLHLHSGEKP